MQGIKGIDVSRYQGDIDWLAAAADGVSFAMIKALQGANSVDKCFLKNAEGAAAAGVPFGVYVYSKANNANEASAEAEAALSLVSGLELSYPIAMDFESKHFLLLSEEERGAVIDSFCLRIKAAGFIPLLYSSKNWLTNVIPAECAQRWNVWLAQWRRSDPDYEGPFTMWQFGKGEVAGIEGKVDMDISLVDYPAMIADSRPIRFAVTNPRLTGEAVLKMQQALIAANYTDASGDPLDPDGVWGKKSQQALDKLVKAQTEQ